jgi:hypothetical protein
MSEGHRHSLAEDSELLVALGTTHVWEFATFAGVPEQTAASRLRRLHSLGLASRHRERGSVAWTYEAVRLP